MSPDPFAEPAIRVAALLFSGLLLLGPAVHLVAWVVAVVRWFRTGGPLEGPKSPKMGGIYGRWETTTWCLKRARSPGKPPRLRR